MTDRELMQQALDALLRVWHSERNTKHSEAIEAIRARLAQPEQEPVAWTERELELIDGMIEVQVIHAERCDSIANRAMAEKQKGWDMERIELLRKIRNTAPPQREFIGLTDKEILDAWLTHRNTSEATDGFARAIEAKLKEKNA